MEKEGNESCHAVTEPHHSCSGREETPPRGCTQLLQVRGWGQVYPTGELGHAGEGATVGPPFRLSPMRDS